MAEATLKFDLDDPDDSMSLKRCVKSLDMACVLFEVVNNMNRSVKVPDEVMKFILSEMESHNVNLDELII